MHTEKLRRVKRGLTNRELIQNTLYLLETQSMIWKLQMQLVPTALYYPGAIQALSGWKKRK